jgi:hypothetical protein
MKPELGKKGWKTWEHGQKMASISRAPMKSALPEIKIIKILNN